MVVNEGRLRGMVQKLYDGSEYYSFKGIPYAQPPVGKLRFKVNKITRRSIIQCYKYSCTVACTQYNNNLFTGYANLVVIFFLFH